MKLHQPTAEILIPDGTDETTALSRTVSLGIGAHQDDLEMMALPGILSGMREKNAWFTGVTCTDGAGSPRSGIYADYTNEQMMAVRWQEQRAAAMTGKYSAMIQLKHPSSMTKDGNSPAVREDLSRILQATRPRRVFTHNLADKHDTHVAVTLRTIAAIRTLPADQRPANLYGTEIWRGLDWLPDEDKVAFDLSGGDHIAAALLGVFDSQVAGGKRYDLGALGRWRANATFFASHAVDTAQYAVYTADLTPLIQDDSLDVVDYMLGFVDKFRADIKARITRQR